MIGAWGLGNMRTRASQIDGKLDIQTAAGHGTSIVLTVPIPSFQRAPASKGPQGVPMDLIEGGQGRSTRLALFVRRSHHQRPAMDAATISGSGSLRDQKQTPKTQSVRHYRGSLPELASSAWLSALDPRDADHNEARSGRAEWRFRR
jgi:hypothetical protein